MHDFRNSSPNSYKPLGVTISQERSQCARFSQFLGHKGCVWLTMLKIVAPFKMTEQMLPWQLRTFGKCLLIQLCELINTH